MCIKHIQFFNPTHLYFIEFYFGMLAALLVCIRAARSTPKTPWLSRSVLKGGFMYKNKINLIYWTAAILNRPMDYIKAGRIAKCFSEKELDRIYKLARKKV